MISLAALAAALVLSQAALPGTLTFREAMGEAVAHSPDLEAARARLDQAREIAAKARGALLPRIVAAGTWNRNDRPAELPALPPQLPEPVVLQPRVGASARIEATLPIVAPALWATRAAASVEQRRAERSAEVDRREILFGVARLYLAAAGSRVAAEIAARQVAVMTRRAEDARVREEAGATGTVDRLRAELDVHRTEQDLELARAAHATALRALATALGRPEADFEVEDPSPELLPPDEPAPSTFEAIRGLPEVQAAAAAVDAARRERHALWASYLPEIGAFARGEGRDPAGVTGERHAWAVGLSATWTLFDGTVREARLRESGARLAEATARERATTLAARDELERARIDLAAATRNRERARAQAALARQAQQLVQELYREGAGTSLDASDANARLAAAELGEVAERVTAQLAALRVQRAEGRPVPGT